MWKCNQLNTTGSHWWYISIGSGHGSMPSDSRPLHDPMLTTFYIWCHVTFKQILVIGGWGIYCEITLIWMSLDFTDDQSTLVQVMACCVTATSHYLNQCWYKPMLPYGITRPQWVNVALCKSLLYMAKFTHANSYVFIANSYVPSWKFHKSYVDLMICPMLFFLDIHSGLLYV